MRRADARVVESVEVSAVIRNKQTGEIVADLGKLNATPAERARRAMAGEKFHRVIYQSPDYKE